MEGIRLAGNSFTDKYYEALWSQIALSISPQEEARISETIDLIPQDCDSILDVGCGDGRITNRLVTKYNKVFGLDSSEEALKHVKSDRVLGSLDSLQFPDRSFDLLLCCEVLEHLPYQVYEKALKEIERVARKYIVVTVPNQEDSRLSSISCPYCGCAFDINRHIRLFDTEKLKSLFVHFGAALIKPCVLTEAYPGFVTRVGSMILTTPVPDTALCPQCGYSGRLEHDPLVIKPAPRQKGFLATSLRQVAKTIPKKRKGIWLLGLYERK